jgi:DUF2934 family protein
MTTKNPAPKKSTSTRSRKTPAVMAVPQEPRPTAQAPLDQAIAELAHRLYIERGGAHGHDVEDWLEAERRLRNGH